MRSDLRRDLTALEQFRGLAGRPPTPGQAEIGGAAMTDTAKKMKLINEQFIDWEAYVFGYGYGTGESRTLHALRQFLSQCTGETGSYNYRDVERACGETVAWLMINILCRASIIEYGTSPRHGWLSDNGKKLKQYMESKSDVELYDLVTSKAENYIHCAPDYCNCGPHGFVKGQKCNNQFWP
jgi:hypothetical protein